MAEAETEHELHAAHQDLVRALADQHAHVVALKPGESVSEEAFGTLMKRAETLLAFEQQLPARLVEPRRLRSQKVIYWSWRVQSSVAAALIVASHLLGHTGWWLVLVLPHLLATFAGWSLEATLEEHLPRRTASIGLHLLGALLVLVVLGVVSPWFIAAVLVGWAAVGVAVLDERGAVK
ncbi:hypothetical protein ACFWD7_55815 [Streptomyces mirabilis]|uniref:hypothetical protein n=1 Tax=Streptomyces mirabilis TaxID=68239 RepID=UPI0036B795A2